MAISSEEKEILVQPKDVSTGGDFQIDSDEMAKCGVHFGHRTSGSHPKMKPYISGVRNNVNIIDLDKTAERLEAALKFIQGLVSQNKILMIVGTKVQVKDLVKETGQELDLLYINERWLGGTLSNFSVIKKRIDYFKDLEKKKVEKELEKYTKKERADFDQELKKLEIKFGGLKKMEKLPDAILLLDMKKDWVALKEAKSKKIKIIAIADTNVDPTLVDFPIPANDDALCSVRYILDKVKETIKKAKKKQKTRSNKELFLRRVSCRLFLNKNMILIDKLKQLRKETCVSMSDCEKALKEAGGEIDKAKEILRKKGKEVALKRVSRETKQGIVDIYLHPNKKVGVMLQINCETDFVAKSEEFKNLSHEICLQIAAMSPLFLKDEDIPAELLDGEKQIYQEQVKSSGKPQKIVDQIIEGKLKKYKEGVCLLSQIWIKDENKTIKDLVDEAIAKIGENMAVKKFVRYEI